MLANTDNQRRVWSNDIGTILILVDKDGDFGRMFFIVLKSMKELPLIILMLKLFIFLIQYLYWSSIMGMAMNTSI